MILELCPDIHSLWNYRREILLHFKENEEKEAWQNRMSSDLWLTEVCLRLNPKSYCAWHHRMWLMENMPNPDWERELNLCNKYLDLDERNFLTWNYRKFVVDNAGVSAEDELKYTDSKLSSNFSNYSSWHYRSKLLPLVHPDPSGERPIDEHNHKIELDLVQNAAFTDPNDQSAWFYQRWLLGRPTSKQCIVRALLSPELSYVVLSQPTCPKLHFLIDGEPIIGAWKSADQARFSQVWVFTPSLPLTLPGTPVSFTIDDLEVKMNLSDDGKQASVFTPPTFGTSLSDGLKSVMEEVLDSCYQLLEFEPDSKWTLFTAVLLIQSIDRSKYEKKSMEILDKLIEVDFLRANYYRDLRSRLILEYAIERLSPTEQSLDLSNMGLTALYHAPLLSSLDSITFGANSLSRPLPQLSALLSCKTLVLDNNGIVSLKMFGAMPQLESLYLCHNKLHDPQEVRHLSGCKKIRKLDVTGNPMNTVELGVIIVDLLPTLTHLNGDPL